MQSSLAKEGMSVELELPEAPGIPVYQRIADAVSHALASGRVKPEQQLPPHLGLAKSLGVSPQTVSRAYGLLTERGIVRQRRGSGTFVLPDAVERLASVRHRTLDTVAIVLGETSVARCAQETIFIVTDMLEGIRGALGKVRTHFTFLESLTRAEVANLTERDAVILMSPRSFEPGLAEELVGRGIPVVGLGNDALPTSVPRVRYDQHRATALACRHLVRRGFQRIGFIGNTSYPDRPVAPKFSVFTQVMHAAGLDVGARYVKHARSARGEAYAMAHEFAEGGDLPEAFFVDTDYKAMEVILALGKDGVRVPRDVEIVSYDDVPEAATFAPPLTTVRVPRHEQGRRAAELLLDWPRDGRMPAGAVLQAELVVRESCGMKSAGVATPHP